MRGGMYPGGLSAIFLWDPACALPSAGCIQSYSADGTHASLTGKLPWWVLVGTGAYLLFQVGWGLFTFNDTPKAHEELLMVCDACWPSQDIKTAKDYLSQRGVSIDS